ncbi:MAG: alanine/glycine:cation symporter family protein [Bowdeniella nasicola]|nr:alanine/glycine:cation symporter family protein [Bowdeniella nasicola]
MMGVSIVESIGNALARLGETLTGALMTSVDFVYSWLLVYVLIIVGLGLTFYFGAPQLRNAGELWRSIRGSRGRSGGGITSFQAFAVGVGTRVGIGNIGGVALALIVGGPGAIFWMWVVAILGMATSMAESVLAQLYKVRHPDGSFRGGPAYYISKGLRARPLAVIFALITMVASGMAVPMVQINTVAGTLAVNHGVDRWVTTGVFFLALAPVILGGMRSVARASEFLAPVMALIYVALTLVIVVMNPVAAWNALVLIVASAFGFGQVAGGVAGGVFVALINGARRGLFSNEAGLGTTPHAAGTATVSHPGTQGFVQAFGVGVDTLIVCTATALMILVSGVYEPDLDPSRAASLTAEGVTASLGSWMALPMSIIIAVFAYTSAYGAYSYGQVALDLFRPARWVSLTYRTVVLIVASLGAVTSLVVVWALSDLLLGLGALVNLVAVAILARQVRATLRDYLDQRRSGLEPVFDPARAANAGLRSTVWNREDTLQR